MGLASVECPLAVDRAQCVDDDLLLGVEIDVRVGASIEIMPRAASMPTTGFPDLGLGIGLAVYLGMVASSQTASTPLARASAISAFDRLFGLAGTLPSALAMARLTVRSLMPASLASA